LLLFNTAVTGYLELLNLKGDLTMLEKVQEVLEQVRPMLQRDGGDVELVEVTPENIVKVKLQGACGSCPMSTMTLKMGIERAMKEAIPEIVEVQQVR
jgi:Fe-S cluster biogenesis protein NfuA